MPTSISTKHILVLTFYSQGYFPLEIDIFFNFSNIQSPNWDNNPIHLMFWSQCRHEVPLNKIGETSIHASRGTKLKA